MPHEKFISTGCVDRFAYNIKLLAMHVDEIYCLVSIWSDLLHHSNANVHDRLDMKLTTIRLGIMDGSNTSSCFMDWSLYWYGIPVLFLSNNILLNMYI